MAKPKVTEREVRLARAFLKRIHGNQVNGYLLLAVIAWLRAGLKRGDKFMRTLSKYSAATAGILLADKLRARIKAKPANYRGLLARIDDTSKVAAQQADQARDFLMSIAMSSWDSSHYGWRPGKDGYWLTRALPNGSTETIWVPPVAEKPPSLIALWASLTGGTIPNAWFIDKTTTTTQKTTVKKTPPRQPRSLEHALIRGEYIQPYAARAFYEARPHAGQFVLEDDGLDPSGL